MVNVYLQSCYTNNFQKNLEIHSYCTELLILLRWPFVEVFEYVFVDILPIKI